MNSETKAIKNLPVCYAMMYFHMAVRARELGYALALHGSMTRDCDMIAVPWTGAAVSAEELAQAMIETSGGSLGSVEKGNEYFEKGSPGAKPHGRLVWSIHLGGGPYIDLSVMPRLADSEENVKIPASF